MKILLVDDAAFVRMSLKKIIEDAGFEFTFLEASTGTQAIESYRINEPDLVIMDITMPEMNGIEAVQEIKKINPDAKIIMCSAMGYQAKVLEAVDAGALDFIIKPYETEKVISSIKTALKLY